MPDPNKEYPYILSKTRTDLLQQRFYSVAPDVVAKYFPVDPYGRLDFTKHDTFDLDLQRMKTEDPGLFQEVARFLRSNCDLSFNAYCSDEQVAGSNSLIDYSIMVSQTSDVGKYFRS